MSARMEETEESVNSRCFSCYYCDSEFKTRSGLWKHKKKCDKLSLEESGVDSSLVILEFSIDSIRCLEDECLFSCRQIEQFQLHLTSSHNVKIETENISFKCYQDFLDWKENYEKTTISSFYKKSTRKNKTSKIEYFVCNRSGYYYSQSMGKRKLKAQGTSKINNCCTAIMKVRILHVDGSVKANVCHTHYGHDRQLCHLRIPKTDKQDIALELIRGEPPNKILNNLKTNKTKSLERKHLINKTDLHNISNAYGIKRLEPHSEDSLVDFVLI